MGLAIAVAIRSFDPSLFTQLIVPYLLRDLYRARYSLA